MADTADLAPPRATTPRRSAANGAAGSRRSSRANTDNLEAQVAQLQNDLKSITSTLSRMGNSTVDDLKGAARSTVKDVADRGQSALDTAQEEFGELEKQLKDTIREKPLTAVAGALALGFVLAVLTR